MNTYSKSMITLSLGLNRQVTVYLRSLKDPKESGHWSNYLQDIIVLDLNSSQLKFTISKMTWHKSIEEGNSLKQETMIRGMLEEDTSLDMKPLPASLPKSH